LWFVGLGEQHATIENPPHNASIIDFTSWRITHNQEKYEIIYIFFLEIAHVYKYSMYSLEIKVFVV